MKTISDDVERSYLYRYLLRAYVIRDLMPNLVTKSY